MELKAWKSKKWISMMKILEIKNKILKIKIWKIIKIKTLILKKMRKKKKSIFTQKTTEPEKKNISNLLKNKIIS